MDKNLNDIADEAVNKMFEVIIRSFDPNDQHDLGGHSGMMHDEQSFQAHRIALKVAEDIKGVMDAIKSVEAERLKKIQDAANLLRSALQPAQGYNPGNIGYAFADALMAETIMEEDLQQECLSLVIGCAAQRMNDHYDRIHKRDADAQKEVK
jgi:hypothetical protein